MTSRCAECIGYPMCEGEECPIPAVYAPRWEELAIQIHAKRAAVRDLEERARTTTDRRHADRLQARANRLDAEAAHLSGERLRLLPRARLWAGGTP